MEILLPDLPDKVVGIIASGQVTASDYENVVIPAIESTIETHGSVRIFYQLGPAFTGFTSGAMWDDMKLGISHETTDTVLTINETDKYLANYALMIGKIVKTIVNIFSSNEKNMK
jgi:hypothetical protein